MKYLTFVVLGIICHILYFFTRIFPKGRRGDIFGGGDSNVSDIEMPEWYTDPLYTSSQDYLNTYGTNILEGKLPSFYSSLGQTGSDAFKAKLAQTNRDTAIAVNENLVRRGISRSGVGLSTTAKQVANNSTNYNWADYLQAQTEKASLLNTGLNTLSGVRSSALTNQSSKNQFNLGVTGLELNQASAEDQTEANEGSMWSQLIGSGISAAALIASAGMLAPATATTGVGLGTANVSGLGAIGTLSSIDYKKDVENITNSLNVVNKMRGVRFNWKENDIQDGGVIAEELEKVLPEAVMEISGVKYVKPMMIIGYLIEAVKDLSEQLERKK